MVKRALVFVLFLSAVAQAAGLGREAHAATTIAYDEWVERGLEAYRGVYLFKSPVEVRQLDVEFSGQSLSVRMERHHPDGTEAAPVVTASKVIVHGSRARAEFPRAVIGSTRPQTFQWRFVLRSVSNSKAGARVVPDKGLLVGSDFYGRLKD